MEVLLKENDSFVYLSAIQAMVDAVNKAPLTGDNSRYKLDLISDDYFRLTSNGQTLWQSVNALK